MLKNNLDVTLPFIMQVANYLYIYFLPSPPSPMSSIIKPYEQLEVKKLVIYVAQDENDDDKIL